MKKRQHLAAGRIKYLKRQATKWGRYTAEAIADADVYDLDDVKFDAKMAFFWGGQALDFEATVYAPHQTILNNKLALQSRMANRPRCTFQNRTVVTDEKTGEQHTRIGAECGGKIKLRRRAGRVVGFECAVCGRYTSVEETHEAVGELDSRAVVPGADAGAADEGVVSAEGGVAA